MSTMSLQRAIDHVQVVVTSSHLPGWQANRDAWAVISAHLAQPAQAVDVGAIRGVIERTRKYYEVTDNCRNDPAMESELSDIHEVLTRALSGEKAGPVGDGWKLVPLELTPEMAAAASAAVWPVASAEDREKARAAALIVLKTTMNLVPGATLDSLAAAIATMFPAYRAFIAASPAPDKEQA